MLNAKLATSSPAALIGIKRMLSSASNLILLEETPKVGIITLNRPKALNALNVEMISQIYEPMIKWENTKSLVIIKGAGEKAFCAGGDIKALVTKTKYDRDYATKFMREEYTLNHLIGTYKIPYVALIDGITMGGGVGLSMHGKYRVATERTMFAMPETAIGLFPDVGGSHILSRMDGKFGSYLALTGDRLKGKELLKCGLATHFCESTNISELEKALIAGNSNNKEIEAILSKFCPKIDAELSLDKYRLQIDECFDSETVEEIFEKLKSDKSDWAAATLKILNKMCPQSLKITHRQIQLAKSYSLAECLQMDMRLVSRIVPDINFVEGVRAMVIEKTMDAKWNPATLDGITQDKVESFFEKLPEDQELKLNEQRIEVNLKSRL